MRIPNYNRRCEAKRLINKHVYTIRSYTRRNKCLAKWHTHTRTHPCDVMHAAHFHLTIHGIMFNLYAHTYGSVNVSMRVQERSSCKLFSSLAHIFCIFYFLGLFVLHCQLVRAVACVSFNLARSAVVVAVSLLVPFVRTFLARSLSARKRIRSILVSECFLFLFAI